MNRHHLSAPCIDGEHPKTVAVSWLTSIDLARLHTQGTRPTGHVGCSTHDPRPPTGMWDADKVEQIVKLAMQIAYRPTVQLGLDTLLTQGWSADANAPTPRSDTDHPDSLRIVCLHPDATQTPELAVRSRWIIDRGGVGAAWSYQH